MQAAANTKEQCLQLRIDGELADLGEKELLLPAGGRIVRTAAPRGIQIEYPGGTVVVITPHWWDYRQLWYLDIDGRGVRATEGVMGAVAPDNWLPALADGSFMGPMPSDLTDRYFGLYEKFADSWRVSDATTLFDFAPGDSTGTFTIDSWPGPFRQTCPLPGEPGPQPPQEPLPQEVALQLCSDVVAEDRRAYCVQDVMATGEAGFAQAYLLTEEIESNSVPTTPLLVRPNGAETVAASTVNFKWNGATDLDGDPVTYKHCVWPADQPFTLLNCSSIPPGTTSWDAALVPGKAYFWKIIAEDGKGGNTESETRRFTTPLDDVAQFRVFLPFADQ